MAKTSATPLPSLQRLLSEMGENIRLARLRRNFSAILLSERAGISRNTLRAIERGDPTVSIGAYAHVLASLGLESDISLLAQKDDFGRQLQDENLPLRARSPKKRTGAFR
jgi:transcriptional regulator with XRE-family HTH domain